MPAVAQIELTPDDPNRAKLARQMDRALADHKDRALACHVEAVRPRLSYSFRFFSGYYATMPARQFPAGSENRVAAFIRVKAEESGETRFFVSPIKVPTIPEDPGKTEFETGGGFYVGEGAYTVDWVLADQKNRVCVRTWTVHTPHTKVGLLIPPHTVQPLGLETWKGFGEKAGAGRVTVFLSVMPVYRRRMLSKLPPYDLAILLSSLTTLLNSTKYGHARVVAFDLLGKRVLFEQDEFDSSAYKKLRDTLENTSYGTIDYKVMMNGITDRKLLEQIVRRETEREDKSDAVVFLGAEGPPSDKLPPVFSEYRKSLARLYYVVFARFPQPVQDVAWQFVHAGKGKTVALYSPPDLVNAIKAIDSGN